MVIIIIYLMGSFVGYFLFRKAVKTELEEYKISNRITGITISLLSWVAVIAILVAWPIAHIRNNNDLDKPAKW